MFEQWTDEMIEQEQDRQILDMYLQDLNGVTRSSEQKRLTSEQEATIRERVSRLPRAERLAIYLYFWEDSSTGTIAAALDISTQLVEKLIHNALARLRGELESVLFGNHQLKGQIKMGVAA